jgi:hypothetical protein
MTKPYVEPAPEHDPLNLGALEGCNQQMIFTAMLILSGIHVQVEYGYNSSDHWARLVYMVGPTGAKMLLKDEPSAITAPVMPKLVV